MNEEEKHYVVDSNGEVIQILDNVNKFVVLEAGDRVLRKGSIEYLKDTINIKYSFIKVNTNVPDEFFKKHPALLILMKNVEYMTNIITYSNGKVVKPSGVAKLCEISESTAKRYIKRMIEDDVIHKVKVDGKIGIMLNPFLCYRGKNISVEAYEEFKNSDLAKYGTVKERKVKR